jgi:hypothetical protein
MASNEPGRPSSGTPTSALLQSLADAAGRLVRQELRQGQEELKDKARESAAGVALLVGAGVLGAAATGTATVLVLRVLDQVMPRPLAAAVATAGLGGTAAALAFAGIQRIREVNPVPEQTLRSIRADVQAAARTIDEP